MGVQWPLNLKKTPYIVLVVILIAGGMTGAYALTITLGADLIEIIGILDMNNNKITNVANPTASTDAATKGYVDSSNGTDTLALLGCTADQVSRWDGNNWVCSSLDINPHDSIISIDIDGTSPTSIAIGTDGNPVISYRGINNLKVAHCGNTSCSAGNNITAVDSADSIGLWTSIAIGTDGNPVISYHIGFNSNLGVVHCGNISCSTGNTLTVVDSLDNVGQYTSIAIGTDGNPVISYADHTNNDLKVAHCGNKLCSAGNTITTVGSEGDAGDFTSIAIGTDGNPVISYWNYTNDDLAVAHCGNTSCSAGNTITTVDATDSVGLFTSIAIGTDGNPVISYSDQTNDILKVAHCGNVSCSAGNTITTVDDDATLDSNSHGTSIAIGSDNNPVVVYTDDDLLLLNCGNASCSAGNTITIVENNIPSGLTGFGPSIAIGTDGNPVISFANAIESDLRVAHCGSKTVCDAIITFD
jgi:hypothetical protein